MAYQKAFAEAVKEIRKHIDGETEDSAKMGLHIRRHRDKATRQQFADFGVAIYFQ